MARSSGSFSSLFDDLVFHEIFRVIRGVFLCRLLSTSRRQESVAYFLFYVILYKETGTEIKRWLFEILKYPHLY
jgi:hypothetical protein